MESLKKNLKKILPRSLIQLLVNPFHLLEAIVATIVYGYPARNLEFIGITGTKGKTTTANMLSEILVKAGHRVGLNSTAVLRVDDEVWENDLGLTTANAFKLQKLLARMKRSHCDIVVMEVSSHALVQHRVLGLRFDTVVWTNLQRDHLDYHHTMENYAKAKAKLFSKNPQLAVMNADDSWVDYFSSKRAEAQLFFGVEPGRDSTIVKAKLGASGSAVTLRIAEHELDVKLNLPGKFNVINALAAATTAYGMGVSLEHIKAGIEAVKAVPGRMEVIDEGQDATVIVDFAHTEESLRNVLQTIRTTLQGRLITVLGGDGQRDAGKRTPLGVVTAELSEMVVVCDQEPYDDDPDEIREQILIGVKKVEKVKPGVLHKVILNRREAIHEALRYGKKGDVVVITGLGCQPYRQMAGGKIKWDERKVVREELRKLKK